MNNALITDEQRVLLMSDVHWDNPHCQRDKLIESTLQKHPSSDKLLAAVVTRVSAKNVHAILANGDDIDIAADGLRWAAAALAPKAPAALQIKPGSVIRVVSAFQNKTSNFGGVRPRR